MNVPTLASPWYVLYIVQNTDAVEYYQDGDDIPLFTEDKKTAFVTLDLRSAHRIAVAEGASIRILTQAHEAAEFGRKDA